MSDKENDGERTSVRERQSMPEIMRDEPREMSLSLQQWDKANAAMNMT
jgi:hypothetical protein